MSLKVLRNRINSVKSTQKITSAMKMVAASRLRKSQNLITTSSFYYDNLLVLTHRIIKELGYNQNENDIKEDEFDDEVLDIQEVKQTNRLLVVFSSDKGLCGGFNANIARETSKMIKEYQSNKEDVKLVCVGKKAKDLLKKDYEELILETIEHVALKGADYVESNSLLSKIEGYIAEYQVDFCNLIYSKFITTMSRDIVSEQLYPFDLEDVAEEQLSLVENNVNGVSFEYEPEKEEILEDLKKYLYKAKFYKAIVNSQASEQGARMVSMDTATRNAEEMIGKLTLKYNGIRQSAITTELIEIIAGAEAI